ncbi:MAG: hypothetical protein QXJ59_01630 [Thermofilaceae archaeon]
MGWEVEVRKVERDPLEPIVVHVELFDGKERYVAEWKWYAADRAIIECYCEYYRTPWERSCCSDELDEDEDLLTELVRAVRSVVENHIETETELNGDGLLAAITTNDDVVYNELVEMVNELKEVYSSE